MLTFKISPEKILESLQIVFEVSLKSPIKTFIDIDKIFLEIYEESIIFKSYNNFAYSKIKLDNEAFSSFNTTKEFNAQIQASAFKDALKTFDCEEVKIEISETTLKIIDSSDEDNFFEASSYSEDTKDFSFIEDSKYINSISIDKHYLYNAFSNILKTVGFEETDARWNYCPMRISKERVRFVSGSGGIFTIVEYLMSDCVKKNPSGAFNVLFSKFIYHWL